MTAQPSQARRPERWYFLISHKQLSESHGVTPILDMLRYTGAIVENNNPPYFWMFSAAHWRAKEYLDRFRSFGIQIYGPWPSRVGVPYELKMWAESYTDEHKEEL